MDSTAVLKKIFENIEIDQQTPTIAPTFTPTIAPSMSESHDRMNLWLLGGLGAGLLFLAIVACLLSRFRVAAIQQSGEQDASAPRYGQFNYYFAYFFGRRVQGEQGEEIPLLNLRDDSNLHCALRISTMHRLS